MPAVGNKEIEVLVLLPLQGAGIPARAACTSRSARVAYACRAILQLGGWSEDDIIVSRASCVYVIIILQFSARARVNPPQAHFTSSLFSHIIIMLSLKL